jgi:uncharacterized protein (DUF2267 family)
MSVDAIGPIEAAVHTMNSWLKELDEELDWKSRQRAYHALRVVLHALRDRLTLAEVADLGSQLPLLIRGLFYEGWNPNGKPVKERKREEFLAIISAAFQNEPDVYPEAVAWAVFKMLERHVSTGEIADVRAVLPAAIRSLWPERLVPHRA